MSPYPWSLKYWSTGEFQVCQDRLRGYEGQLWNPGYKNLFAALRLVPLDKVRVVILGQDPFPNHQHATGIAFSVPPDVKTLPPTLQTILREYEADLHYPTPKTGDLTEWCKQGVLLWNVVPSCEAGNSLSHQWPEWEPLTDEILEKLRNKPIVVAALGHVAKRFVEPFRDPETRVVTRDYPFPVVLASHPSPRGNKFSSNPFTGSRLFTTINTKLKEIGQPAIDWRLP